MKHFYALIIAGGMFTLPSGAIAQQINTPLQDERLNLVRCLAAIEDLQPSYRTHMAKSCVEIPLKVCALRGTAVPCLQDTNGMLRAFYDNVRSDFPTDIEGSEFVKRAYKRGLMTIDRVFSAEPEDEITEQALSAKYKSYAQATVDLFYRAHQAKLDLPR